MRLNHTGAAGASFTALVILSQVSVSGCQKDDTAPASQINVTYIDTVGVPPNAVADVDGHIYSTVVIGSQRWMAENLRTAHFANGDPIPYIPDGAQWAALTTGAWSNYATDAGYDDIYGKLYNWYTVVDPRNVCPSGWHVPSDDEWDQLELNVGVPASELNTSGPQGVSANAGGRLKSTALWNSPNYGANDSSGFSALPGGIRQTNGTFFNIGLADPMWSTLEFDTNAAWTRELTFYTAGIYRVNFSKVLGCSVRCLKD